MSETAIPESQWHRFHWLTPLGNVWQIWLFLLLGIGSLLVNLAEMGRLDDLASGLLELTLRYILMALGVLLAVSAVTAIVGFIIWRFQKFAIVESGVHTRTGVFKRDHRQQRWDRIQTVEIHQGLFSRLVGLGTLIVDSGSGTGATIKLGLLPVDRMGELRRYILDRAKAAREGLGDFSGSPQEPLHEVSDDDNGYLLYSLPAGRLVASIVMSERLLAVLALVGSSIAISYYSNALSLVAIAVATVSALGLMWASFNSQYDQRLYLRRDGIRIRRGLTKTYTQTIVPQRIHSVEFSQPLLWRFTGWWRVRVVIAGMKGSSGDSLEELVSSNRTIMIPVGSRDDAQRILWTIIPDLGVGDPAELITEAIHGRGRLRYFTQIPRRARIVNPIGWQFSGFAGTPTIACIRRGRWIKSISFTFHGHWQGIVLRQGPIQRWRQLATFQLALVPGLITPTAKNLDLAAVHRLTREELAAASRVRYVEDRERLDDWAHRVGVA